MSEKSHYIFKVCLLGQGGVGKTCLARRFCFDRYDDDTKLTIGINFYTYELPVIINGIESTVSLTIWDFGGQDQFKDLFPYYIHGTNGVFMCFSMVNMQSLLQLEWWYDKLFKYIDPKIPRIVLGTKDDLLEHGYEKSKIDLLFIEQFLNNYNEKDFFRISSKENYNIKRSFKLMTKRMLDYLDLNYDQIL